MAETHNVGTANVVSLHADSFEVPVVIEEDILKAVKETTNKKAQKRETGLSTFAAKIKVYFGELIAKFKCF